MLISIICIITNRILIDDQTAKFPVIKLYHKLYQYHKKVYKSTDKNITMI